MHPYETYLAIAGVYGYFSIWNYVTKEKLNIDYKSEGVPTAMEYTPDGK